MVYRRRYRRYRRTGRYGRYNLSKFNLYRKSGSKSQAMQIYRVNKKLSRYARYNKPKVSINFNTVTFNAGVVDYYAFGSPTTMVTTDNANNGKILFRLHDCTMNFVVTSNTKLSDTQFADDPYVLGRVVIFQYKAAHSNIDTQPWDIWPVTQADMQSNVLETRKKAALECIFGPFYSNITSKIKILRDIKLRYNAKNIDVYNKKVKMKSLRNLRIAADKTYPQGTICWVAVYWSNAFANPNTEAKVIRMHVFQKIAYTSSK